MVTILRTIVISVFLSMGLLSTTSYAALVDVTADRTEVSMDESFTLTFESKEDVDDDPDFSVLERDFQILSQSQQSSVQIVNGRMDKKKSWIVTLMPKRAGKLIVPPVSFGDDNSQLIKIVVNEQSSAPNGSSSEDMFLEVSVDNESPYVQAQILYRVKLYRAINTSNASLTEPTVSSNKAIVTRLGEDVQYNKYHSGRNYQVVERRYAIFPQQSGEMTIDPLLFEADIQTGGRYGLQLFNPGMNRKRVRSDSITVNVLPIPPNHSGEWLPTTQLNIEAKWPDASPDFRVGEPVTRTIIVQAERLTAAQIPEIKMNLPPTLKQYPDQPQLNDNQGEIGILGERIEKIAIIPTTPGKITLPQVEMKWWDITQKQERTAIIPASVINVLPALGSNKNSTVTPPTLPADAALPAQQQSQTSNATRPQGWLDIDNYWIWTTVLFALMWLITSVKLLRQRSDHHTSQEVTSEVQLNRSDAEKAVKEACEQSDAVKAREAIIEWGGVVWSHHPPMTLQEIIERVPQSFADELNLLNRSLYSAGSHRWVGDSLWRMVKGYRVKASGSSLESELPSLYQ